MDGGKTLLTVVVGSSGVVVSPLVSGCCTFVDEMGGAENEGSGLSFWLVEQALNPRLRTAVKQNTLEVVLSLFIVQFP